MLVVARHDPAAAQRAIKRFIDESRHLGLVRHLKTGIQVGLEGELAKERQAEGVDGADRDVGSPVAQLAPAGRWKLAACTRTAKRRDDSLAHLGRGLAGEGERQDFGRVDTFPQQVHVAVDQDACLACTGRCLERHVETGIDGAFAPRPVARVDARLDRLLVERQPWTAMPPGMRVLFSLRVPHSGPRRAERAKKILPARRGAPRISRTEPLAWLNHARSPCGRRRHTRRSRT
jgi:hypothetical protein